MSDDGKLIIGLLLFLLLMSVAGADVGTVGQACPARYC